MTKQREQMRIGRRRLHVRRAASSVQPASRAARALASQISVCPHCHVLHYHPIGCRPAPTCASCGKPVTTEESHNEHRC